MKLVRRSAWGARHGRGGTNITPSRGGVTVHYEGGGRLTGRPHSTCAARVRGIENYHVNTNGWAGIAYSFLACEHGYVFEGRGLGHRTAANGTTSGNQNWYAVCALIGDSDPTSDALLTAIRDAIDHMRANGAGRKINGHRDHLSTSCPGSRLYAWVKKGAPRPKPPTPPKPPMEDTLKTVVDLGNVKPQTVPKGQRRSIAFDLEYADPDKVHPDDGAQPSVAPKGRDAPYAVTIEVVLDSRPAPGAELTFASYTRDNAFERDIRGIELIGARHVLHSNIKMGEPRKYRADIVNNTGADLVIKRAYMFIAH